MEFGNRCVIEMSHHDLAMLLRKSIPCLQSTSAKSSWKYALEEAHMEPETTPGLSRKVAL